MPEPIALGYGRNLHRQTGAPDTADEIRVHDVSTDKVVIKAFGEVYKRTGQEYQIAGSIKAGATAGWVVAGATNLAEATLPQSQTGATLVKAVEGLKVGSTLTGYKAILQIESGGNTVTVDTDLRALTLVAADPTDASIGTTTQVSVTADTASTPSKTGLSEVISATKKYYILVTATTGASCDIRLLGFTATLTES